MTHAGDLQSLRQPSLSLCPAPLHADLESLVQRVGRSCTTQLSRCCTGDILNLDSNSTGHFTDEDMEA